VVNSDVRVFGITATTPQLPPAVLILQIIRRIKPRARVILGGPHVTLMNSARKYEIRKGKIGRATGAIEVLRGIFNILVSGDGERAIFEALKFDASKMVDADEPHTENKLLLTSNDLEELPLPARHLVDVDSYHYSIDGERALSLIAQLGCPFSCGFCGGRTSPSFRRIRTRSTENVVAEMKYLYIKYGVKGFMLYDDELNVNIKMVELMRAIKRVQVELGVEWKLRGFIKAELFTHEQAEAMKEAGFKWILVGFESGSKKILQNINKKATREENTRAMKIAHEHGLKVKALMSIGHPGESLETIEETLAWLIEAKPDDFDISIITVYPGTPYYNEAVLEDGKWVYTYEKTGDRLYQVDVDYTTVANYYKGNPDGGYHAYVSTDYLSAEDLVRERNRVEHEVRAKLNIPFSHSAPAMMYEHSMGQSGVFPSNILRVSKL
jgi:radical SAM superfamily enzyme YgiQ (UPF0313 family)